ncbi:MAG: hypothetical protein IKF52_06795 [Clostridia bacterium]|nr:hypothetical protein [Clostridia bacterium]
MQKIVITPIRNESEIPELKQKYKKELEKKGYNVSSIDVMIHEKSYFVMIIYCDELIEFSMFLDISEFVSDGVCKICFKAGEKVEDNEIFADAIIRSGIREEKHRLKIVKVNDSVFKVLPLTFDEGTNIIDSDDIAEILEKQQLTLKSVFETVSIMGEKGVWTK